MNTCLDPLSMFSSETLGPSQGGVKRMQKIAAVAALPAVDWVFAPRAAALSGSAIRAILKATERPQVLSFAGGLPNPDTFPVAAIRRASERILADEPAAALQYGPTEGYGPLRELIAERLQRSGQPCSAANVLITTGSQQALDLIGKALLSPGATVLADNPGYLGAFQAFALQAPRLVDWRAAAAATPAACCYVTPTFANPNGETLSLAGRQALLARLATAGVPLIEDDPYGELWFEAPPPPSCRALAGDNVLYLGSFSKVLAPGLRVGYVAGPPAVVALLARLKQAADLHTPGLNQRLVAALLADGTLDAHLPALRTRYRDQRDALLDALARHLAPYAEWTAPEGGMFAWLRLKGGLDASALFDAALSRDVAFVPGSPFYFERPDPSTLRLAFSTLDAKRMDEGLARLAEALHEMSIKGDNRPLAGRSTR